MKTLVLAVALAALQAGPAMAQPVREEGQSARQPQSAESQTAAPSRNSAESAPGQGTSGSQRPGCVGRNAQGGEQSQAPCPSGAEGQAAKKIQRPSAEDLSQDGFSGR